MRPSERIKEIERRFTENEGGMFEAVARKQRAIIIYLNERWEAEQATLLHAVMTKATEPSILDVINRRLERLEEKTVEISNKRPRSIIIDRYR